MENNELKSLRTLQTDIQEIEKKGVPIADIVAEAEKRRGFVAEAVQKFSLKQMAVILAGVVVIIALGFGIFWFFNNRMRENQPVEAGPKPILVSDSQVKAGADLNNIQSALKTPIRINNLLYVSTPASPEDFFRIINAHPPQELIDSLGNRFMLAKFYFTKDWPILILSIKSYELAFAGVLKWERTMGQDLSAIFGSTNTGDFSDKEIQNHDTRVGSGLIYSFVNRNYLIIVQDEEPLKEIFRRFSSPQYLNVL